MVSLILSFLYIESMTGQSRFYYDDIDQHTQLNCITRNYLDIYESMTLYCE